MSLKLYQCTGGAIYWIAAKSIQQAQEILRQDFITNEFGNNTDIEYELKSTTIIELSQCRAKSIKCKHDFIPNQNMWDEFINCLIPQVIACSEY